MDNKEDISIFSILKNLMIENVPSYANKIFYSLGFLSMTSFFILIITGVVMVSFGPDWWLTSPAGIFVRSIHLWATQAFVLFILLHVLIVFLTSGYKPPRQLTWVLGALMLSLVLAEAEFGYVLRNDFSSQWRSLQGADFYNGSGLGRFINTLNYGQIYGIHIIIMPLLLIVLLFLHYLLIKTRGIAKPYKKDFKYKMVRANHSILFVRGGVLAGVIVILALLFPSPLIAPVTIKQVAIEDPALMAKTLLSEMNHTSDTATYMDSIDPYKFDTRKVYIEMPYKDYISLSNNEAPRSKRGIKAKFPRSQQPHFAKATLGVPLSPSSSEQAPRFSAKGNKNMLAVFNHETKQKQDQDMKQAGDYFAAHFALYTSQNLQNPVIPIISSLVLMAKSGLYESFLKNQPFQGYNLTYTLRFLSDTGTLENKADVLKITTDQYGMLREGKGFLPPGAWWLAPLGVLDNTVLKNDDNQDRDGAEILGVLMLLLVAFPYIPILNDLPEKLGFYKFFWKDTAEKF